MGKLKKSRPSSTSSSTTSASTSRIPVKSGSPIALRTTARAAPTASNVSATGELGSDSASLRGVSTAGSATSAGSHSRAHGRRPSSSSPIPGQSPNSTQGQQQQFSPIIVPSPSSSPPAASAVLAAEEQEDEEQSALAALRKRMEADEEARRRAEEGPRKLRKAPRSRKVAIEGEGEGSQATGETGSILSRDEFDDSDSLLLTQDEEEPASVLYDSAPPSHSTVLDSLPPPRSPSPPPIPQALAIQPPLPYTPITPTDVVLFIPRLSLSLAASSLSFASQTTKSAILLPFRVASHLPIVGSLVPFTSPSAQEQEEGERHGSLYRTAELSLGLTLAGVMLGSAAVGAVWDVARGGRRRKVHFE